MTSLTSADTPRLGPFQWQIRNTQRVACCCAADGGATFCVSRPNLRASKAGQAVVIDQNHKGTQGALRSSNLQIALLMAVFS